MNRALLPILAIASTGCRVAGPAQPPAAGAARDFADLRPVEGSPLRTSYRPGEIAAACAAAEKTADRQIADLVSVSDGARTFANTFAALERIRASYEETIRRLSFLQHIHVDAAVRQAAAACGESAGRYGVALGARADLYRALTSYARGAGRSDALDEQDRRLIQETLRELRRNGLELTDERRAELVAMRQRLSELTARFHRNLGEDRTTLRVRRGDLAGMPPAWFDAHEAAEDGSILLTTQVPEYAAVMENCRDESTRRRMETAFSNRGGAENLAIVDEQIALRAKAARLLGYRSHLDFVAEEQMAGTGAAVNRFLGRLRGRLRAGLAADAARMQRLKAAETGDPGAVVNAWDWRYYLGQIKQSDHGIDDEAIRRYFPQDKVVAGMFEVYARLLGVSFREIAVDRPLTDGIRLYEVRDDPSGRLLARFYIDFYPRDGKFANVGAEFLLTSGHATPAGYQIPWSYLVLNFARPVAGQTATLSLAELDVLFHEFGHVMHESLTTARFASQAGTRVATDFVEAPSQMFGNWVYEPRVLAMLSRDPDDPSKSMPAELARAIVAARNVNARVWYSRSLFQALFDAAIHTSEQGDADGTARALWAEIMRMPRDPGAHFPGSFSSYPGAVYSYLWSNALQADMFTRFRRQGILDRAVGRAFRDIILARGRTVDPDRLVAAFLGRPPTERAFLEQIGVATGD